MTFFATTIIIIDLLSASIALESSGVARILGRAELKSVEQGQSRR